MWDIKNEGIREGCHACVYETVTPYKVDPATMALRKDGDTIISDRAREHESSIQIVNYHLQRRPLWGPWWLSARDGICALSATSDGGMQVAFILSGEELGLLMGQTHPNDGAPWGKRDDVEDRTSSLQHEGQLPSRITAYIDGGTSIDFSEGKRLPDSMMGARMVLFPGESSSMAAVTKATALSGNHLVMELMWGTNEWGNGATFSRLISMDISGGKNAVTQLFFCATNR